jgi:hypothetical protein
MLSIPLDGTHKIEELERYGFPNSMTLTVLLYLYKLEAIYNAKFALKNGNFHFEVKEQGLYNLACAIICQNSDFTNLFSLFACWQ